MPLDRIVDEGSLQELLPASEGNENMVESGGLSLEQDRVSPVANK